MRKIKFRAWDKGKELYLYNVHDAYDTLSGFVKYDDGECADYDECCFGDFLDNKRYDVEQFTGLKDRNDKEIYEGDILKRKDFIFNDGNFIFLPVEYKYAEWQLGMRRLNDVYKSCEVVGNIHENADLLGDEE